MTRKLLSSISLDRGRTVSLLEQLSQGLKQQIQSGAVETGQPLPSSRELARDLGVSRNTVIAAYDRLLGEGYLETRPRSGIFVSQGLADTRELTGHLPTSKRIRQLATQRKSDVPVSSLVLGAPTPFRPCQPDVNLFPLESWNRLRNRALRKLGAGLLHYQSKCALGLPALRKSLAEYLNASRGVRCTWNQIAVTSGSQQALYLLGQLLLKRGDLVLLEDPGYPGARLAFARAGAKIRRMKVDDQGVIPPARPELARLIYTTPSRQFPTGASLPVARRLAMLEFARRSRAWLLEDDYDSEFRYTRPPLPSLHSLDQAGRVIYLGSMSKVLFPSLRIGYVVLPEELVQPFESLRLIVDDHGPLIDQATLAEFIDSGGFYTHIRRCRKSYAGKLETFLNAAEVHRLPLEFPFADGGMNQTGFFTDSRTDDQAVSQALAARGLDIPSTSHYCLKKTGGGRFGSAPGLVFGFTAFDHKIIQSSLAVVASIMRDART